jgi:hypothetical protein
MTARSTPPPKREQRRYPRFELFAHVQLKRDRELLMLTTRNLSLGGLLLAAEGHDLSGFPVGSNVDVQLFTTADQQRPTVCGPARIVRHEKDAVALAWTTLDPRVTQVLITMLAALQGD